MDGTMSIDDVSFVTRVRFQSGPAVHYLGTDDPPRPWRLGLVLQLRPPYLADYFLAATLGCVLIADLMVPSRRGLRTAVL